MMRIMHRRNRSGVPVRPPFWTAALGLVAILHVAPAASAQEAPSAPVPKAAEQDDGTVLHACYVPSSGTVYRIRGEGLRDACSSEDHVAFSWTVEGPAGPAGRDGVSGWARIEGGSHTLNPGSQSSTTAHCPAGKAPLGGGFLASSDAVAVIASQPTDTGWTVTGRNTSDVLKQGLQAFVICAAVGG